MDFRPDTTTYEAPSQTSDAALFPDQESDSESELGLVEVPLMSKDEFATIMETFYDNATRGNDGFRQEDLVYIVRSACRPRHRHSQRSGNPFEESAKQHQKRQRIVRKFYKRLMDEVCRNALPPENVERLNSALCWAFLQVAHMDELTRVSATLSGPEMPETFAKIEKVFTAWVIQFRVCES